MFEWILITLAVVAIFYAGDLPKVRAFIEQKGKHLLEKAKDKTTEIAHKSNEEKSSKKDLKK